MLARCRRWSLLLLAAAAAAPACKSEESSSEIPAALRGAYGRTDADAQLATLGLEVDVDTIRFSELTVKIIAAKEVGSSLHISEAEVRWAKDNKPPETCKGTIARQGTRLLLSLFKSDGDAKCDSSLDGEWEAWAPITEIPEALEGSYGTRDPYARAEGLKLEGMTITTAYDAVLELDEALMFEARPNHLIVRKGSFDGETCRGHLDLVEDHLEGKLDADERGRGGCPRVFGQRWSVDTARLPKGPITNGKVTVEIRGEAVLLKTHDEQKLRCEQAILRTATRKVTDSGRDGIPVMGGEVLVLHAAKPAAGSDACEDRLDGLAAAECEQYLGVPCEEGMLDVQDSDRAPLACPTHVIIGEPEGAGRKVALLPQDVPNAVCWELREPMKPKK